VHLIKDKTYSLVPVSTILGPSGGLPHFHLLLVTAALTTVCGYILVILLLQAIHELVQGEVDLIEDLRSVHKVLGSPLTCSPI